MKDRKLTIKYLTWLVCILQAIYASITVAFPWEAGALSYSAAVAIAVVIWGISYGLMYGLLRWHITFNEKPVQSIVGETLLGAGWVLLGSLITTGFPTALHLLGLPTPLKGICAAVAIATPIHAIVIVAAISVFPIMHLARFGWTGASRTVEPATVT